MRKILSLALLVVAGCSNNDQKEIQHFYAPEPGTIIISDSMPITEDELNELYYTIKITATDSSQYGHYLLDVAYGYDEAQSTLIYPRLTKGLKPAVRRDTLPYSYIIGFKYDGEEDFKDYARVAATQKDVLNRQIELRYIKGYYVDSTEKK